MAANIRKSVLIGIICGLVTGIAVALLSILNKEASEPLQSIVNFFGSIPAFFAMAYNVSEPVSIVIFFGYWALIGGIFGLLLSLPVPTRYVLTLALLVVLIVAHRVIQVRMEREIQDIVQAIAQILTQAFTPRPTP